MKPLDAPSAEAAIDPEVYGALAETMEDEMASLIDDFLSSTGELLAQLAAAESARDPAAMQMQAHSIKSSAAAVGALPLSELARVLEARAASGRFEGLAEVSAALRCEFARATGELEQLAGTARGENKARQ
jgi:HPt (histidine-containing phosphotransfer) domain-containing protein